MPIWTSDDISWHGFDASRVDAGLLKIAKAAALVERNGADYARYLCNIFADDPAFQQAAQDWGVDETRHGDVLGRWAEMADPDFSFADAFARFVAGYGIPVASTRSVRGSRTGELVARCIVEVGTSAYYTSLQQAAAEPVLAEICRRIATDEFRHYTLFYSHLKRYRDREGVGRWRRLGIALARMREADDDELAFAWHCANEKGMHYDRARCNADYGRHAYPLYRPAVVERGTAMAMKAAGFDPKGGAARLASILAWRLLRARVRRLA